MLTSNETELLLNTGRISYVAIVLFEGLDIHRSLDKLYEFVVFLLPFKKRSKYALKENMMDPVFERIERLLADQEELQQKFLVARGMN